MIFQVNYFIKIKIYENVSSVKESENPVRLETIKVI